MYIILLYKVLGLPFVLKFKKGNFRYVIVKKENSLKQIYHVEAFKMRVTYFVPRKLV